MDDVKIPTQVKLLFLLAGKSKDFNAKSTPDGWSNENTLNLVKSRVATTLRDSRMHVINEDSLLSPTGHYPNHYVAGWFISGSDQLTELVVVAHADSVVSAKRILMDYVPNISWELESVIVGT